VLGATTSDWFVPFVVVVLAAVFAYVGGWVVKRQDVERSIASEADELLEEAQKLAADQQAWSPDQAQQIRRLASTAKLRTRRLNDNDLVDRYFACELFLDDCLLAFRPGQRYWAQEAVSNIRIGLDAYTKPPTLVPRRAAPASRQRIFPTKPEYTTLVTCGADQGPDVAKLAHWQTEHGVR
jgi:hypothetical protein